MWATVVFFTVLAAPVAAFVYAVAFYSLIAWRHKGETRTSPRRTAAPQRGNGPMTVLWLGVSTFLVVVLLFWGITVWSAQQVTHPNTLQVNVTGQQWLWTYSYPGTGVETRTLELPLNRPVQFNVTSVDVTHGFWPAALGVQVDANPNVTTVIRTTPNKLGQLHRPVQPAVRALPRLHEQQGGRGHARSSSPRGSRARGRRRRRPTDGRHVVGAARRRRCRRSDGGPGART